MDIICVKCHEPYEIDVLHEAVADEYYPTFTAAREAFTTLGCRALNCIGITCSAPIGASADPILAEIYALSGDDIDGAAAMIDDADALGLFDN